MARPRSRRRYRWLWLSVFSLFVVLGLALWTGFALRDDVVAWVFMQRLDSDDPNTRAQGAAYLCHHAADDPDLLDAALERLRRAQAAEDHRTERTIVRGLRCAGVWGPRCGEPWLGHLDRQASRSDAAIRARIALALARAGLDGRPIVRDRAAARLIGRLLDDANAAVRYHGLRAAAACGGPHRLDLIAAATNDADPTVRKHAFIMLGLVGVKPNVSLERVLGSPSAEQWAMLWSDANLARQVATDAGAPNDLRAFTPYALRHEPNAAVTRLSMLDDGSGPIAEALGRLATWRAILGMRLDTPGLADAQISAVSRFVSDHRNDGEDWDGPIAAAVCRLQRHATDAGPDERIDAALRGMHWTGRPGHMLRELAYYECAPPASLDETIAGDRPDLVRAMMLRSADRVDPNQALGAFDSEHAAVRHVAVLHAAERFDAPMLGELVRRLVVTWQGNRIMAGAMLSGYTGVGRDVLEQRLDRERNWLVRQHLKLGLFMQGRIDPFDPAGLLVRTDVPRQTVLWAMMHAGRIEALDELIDPLGPADGALRTALDRERMVYVLRRYVPRAPAFWVWADPALQQFQTSVLRNWYLMNRARLQFDEASTTFNVAQARRR